MTSPPLLPQLELDVHIANAAGRAFYKHVGFEITANTASKRLGMLRLRRAIR